MKRPLKLIRSQNSEMNVSSKTFKILATVLVLSILLQTSLATSTTEEPQKTRKGRGGGGGRGGRGGRGKNISKYFSTRIV